MGNPDRENKKILTGILKFWEDSKQKCLSNPDRNSGVHVTGILEES